MLSMDKAKKFSFQNKKSNLERCANLDKNGIYDDMRITSESSTIVFRATISELIGINTIFLITLYIYLLLYNIITPYFIEYRNLMIFIGGIIFVSISYFYGREINLNNLVQGHASRKYFNTIISGFFIINTIYLFGLFIFYYFNNNGTGLNDLTTYIIKYFDILARNNSVYKNISLLNSNTAININNNLFYVYLTIYIVTFFLHIYLYQTATRRIKENIDNLKNKLR